MELYDLRIEYDRHPVGLAVQKPRFSWKLKSDKNNTMQKSYHIVVTNADDAGVTWDSNVVESDASVHVEYAGEALKDETEYCIKVEVTDNHDEKAEAEGSFITGILDPMSFEASMITHDFAADNTNCPVFYINY